MWIQDFHDKYGHLVDYPLATSSAKPAMLFRLRLISEEFAELAKAMDLMDPVEIADALGDLEVVVNGTAVTFGLPLEAIVEEIHQSNMTKGKNVDGKPSKGPDFRKPDIIGVLVKHWKQWKKVESQL